MCISTVTRRLALLLVLAVAATSCSATATFHANPAATELSGDLVSFQASSDFLMRAKRQVEQAESKRFEIFTEIDSPLFAMGSRTEPFMTGRAAGDRSRVDLDMGHLMGPFAALSGLTNDDLTMTMVNDADVLYLHAPFFRQLLGTEFDSAPGGDGWIDVVSNGWGRVDAAALAGSDMLGSFGFSTGADASGMLAVLESTGEVLDGGLGSVRGVPTHILHARVSLSDLIVHAGQNLEGLGVGRTEAAILDGLVSTVEVHVDEQGRVRRVEYVMDFGAIADVDPDAAGFDLSMWQRIDFFGFGDNIEIDLPPDAVDISDELRALAGVGG